MHNEVSSVSGDLSQDPEEDKFVEELTLLLDSFGPVREDTTEMTDVERELKPFQLRFSTLQADIIDHLDENAIDTSLTVVEDVDSKVERLREYRRAYQEIESLFDDADDRKVEFENDYKIMISKMKGYIREAKDTRGKIRKGEAHAKEYVDRLQDEKDNEIRHQKTRAASFLLNEINRTTEELIIEFIKPRFDVTDEEVMRCSEDNMSEVDKLSKKYRQFLETIPSSFPNSTTVFIDTQRKY